MRSGNPSKSHDLAGLTSLRGIAAIMIVMFHFAAFGGETPLIDQTAFFDKAYLWVDMFFMLSGFVIAHVYGEAFERHVDLPSYGRFMWIRFARIYPLYGFALLSYVAITLARYAVRGPVVFDDEHTLAALIETAALVQAWGFFNLYAWNPPAWSISAEVVAYLAFPFLCIVVLRSRLARSAVGIVAVGVLCLLSARERALQVPAGLSVALCLSEFIIGMVLYRSREALYRWRVPVDLLLTLTVLLLALALHFGAPDLVVVALFAPLIWLLPASSGIALRIVNARPLVFLGEISYSVYLMHDLVLFIFVRLTGGFEKLIQEAAGVVVVIGVAALTHRYVERPARVWLRSCWQSRPATITPLVASRGQALAADATPIARSPISDLRRWPGAENGPPRSSEATPSGKSC